MDRRLYRVTLGLKMNEKIEELADQCYHQYSEYNIDLEKFAELLIQQCVMICLNNQLKNESISAGECAYDIQEHFGVD